MMHVGYENRQNWDLPAWPEMYEKFGELRMMVHQAPPGPLLNAMVFTMASLSAGCRHCQAHGAHGLELQGLSIQKIQALWSFESSDEFSDRERAALRFANAAGSTPNAVTAEHHAALREHFNDEEVRTLLAVVSLTGFLNRFNDSLATVTDAASVDWAQSNLAVVGWDIGKHTGAVHEQRTGPPKRR